VRGCVIAGVWGAGKTSIYERVVARLISSGCQSLITLPQATTLTTHTYAPGDPASQAAEILSWLENLSAFLKDAEQRFRRSALSEHRFAHAWTPTCVLEGLGFDLPVYELPVSRYALLEIEHRLALIGLRLVVLHVPIDQIRDRCVESTRRHRGPRWTEYVNGFGPSEHARVEHVERAQDRLMDWARSSPLPLHVFNVDSADWDDLASEVVHLITASEATRASRRPTAPTTATCAGSPHASHDP
jgi:hypothetical protein